ncbi:Ubiquitin carboxyl-terminal hydrolase 17 [Mizuhopecten yessoensis]|uniref:Ubiquitin carboxyl-terminal hydrolase 36 n=1 Tax=Mizuhopecten yessoensis TaxID=6573 RepID=A0A210R603_MIZYE|nr:Ubiquitin carboxyl-terminal hydrolase 17 [Mizuhopecten yessoensis]
MDVMSSFKAAAPQEDGIVVDKESNMCHIATTRLKKTPRSLKLRKRRLVASKRHGVGAEKRRQYHTRKGVEDLLGVSCENMITTEEGVDLLAELHTEDPPCNESTTKPTMLLEKFKGFVSTLTAATLERYTMSASSLSSCDLNMSNRIGGVVLSEYCDSSMDTADLLMSLQSALPPTQLQLPDEVIFTLVCLILDQMEQNGDIQIFQEKHPKQLEKESAEAFRGLIECLKDMKSKAPVPLEPVSEPSMQVSEPSVPVSVSAVVSFGHQAKRKKKNVTFSKEAIQKKRIVISEDKTSAFPGGGLQNLPGQNLCFADSLLQCLRLKDFHKILLQHTCSELGCFICQLRNFIEEGPLSTEVLCGNMKEICFARDGSGETAAQDIFYGLQKSTVKCSSCQQMSTNLERYTDISVSIQKAESINQALKEHFAEENVDFVCARCKNKTMAIKDTKLLTIPKNVVIQLKRFSSARRKINKRMQIQTEILLRNYTADEVVSRAVFLSDLKLDLVADDNYFHQ